MKIKIYTAQEKEFLIKILDVFEVDFDISTVKDVISCEEFEFETDNATVDIIKKCMLYNYKKNFC